MRSMRDFFFNLLSPQRRLHRPPCCASEVRELRSQRKSRKQGKREWRVRMNRPTDFTPSSKNTTTVAHSPIYLRAFTNERRSRFWSRERTTQTALMVTTLGVRIYLYKLVQLELKSSLSHAQNTHHHLNSHLPALFKRVV